MAPRSLASIKSRTDDSSTGKGETFPAVAVARTPSMNPEFNKDPARTRVLLADGGVAGTMEDLTGHKRELKVQMGLGALLALAVANIAPTCAINGSLSTSLVSGGATAILWGWAMWAYQLAPPEALIAAGAQILAAGLLGIAVAFNPDYVQQDWHLVLIYIGVLLLFTLVNLFIVRLMDFLTKSFAFVNLTSVLATIIALAACAPVKQAPSFVFGSQGWINETGWSNKGFVFLLGTLQAGFTLVGMEHSAHLAEEAHNPARVAPIAVFGGTAIVCIVGFLYIITLLFCVQDVTSILETPTGVPPYQVFIDAFGLHGATAAFVINLLILAFAVIGIQLASSRSVYSMSRDGGFPGGKLFRKVNKTPNVPVYALLLQISVPIILGLLSLATTIIFYAFFQLTTEGYLLSYLIPIALLLFRGRDLLPPAYWRMPDWLARICNAASIAYIVLICVLFCIPNFYPVNASNMNYTSVILAVAVLFGTAGWYLDARKKYKGPASQVAHVQASNEA
ncbi:hypothetical protein Rhopal_005337-T1 [Rhodotorula paludigena]|uniref:Amino acid transporter n=1 Tax=Rhodotorula paludigena TaxID=86838 RepID=A0AAV5GSH1_9BASI|nr:hypothetical protein Rhopal_005337-T1 [Rhodotorula paludigena]